jgi:hypothetical protein
MKAQITRALYLAGTKPVAVFLDNETIRCVAYGNNRWYQDAERELPLVGIYRLTEDMDPEALRKQIIADVAAAREAEHAH